MEVPMGSRFQLAAGTRELQQLTTTDDALQISSSKLDG
jgi:hypothetical protein